jgi:hypothetical protein
MKFGWTPVGNAQMSAGSSRSPGAMPGSRARVHATAEVEFIKFLPLKLVATGSI